MLISAKDLIWWVIRQNVLVKLSIKRGINGHAKAGILMGFKQMWREMVDNSWHLLMCNWTKKVWRLLPWILWCVSIYDSAGPNQSRCHGSNHGYKLRRSVCISGAGWQHGKLPWLPMPKLWTRCSASWEIMASICTCNDRLKRRLLTGTETSFLPYLTVPGPDLICFQFLVLALNLGQSLRTKSYKCRWIIDK